ncbi:MAG: hypothetical protein ACI4SK_00590 [Christensenellales bacterium]
MKSKVKIVLFATLLLAIFGALAGCSENVATAKYDYLVTFDYNVGELNANCQDQYLGVKENGLIAIQPGYSSNFKLYEVTGYYVEGWYTAKLDADGNAVVDDATKRVVLDRKWNFDTDRVNKSFTLYANLVGTSALIFVDRATGEVLDRVTGKPGDSKSQPSQTLAPKKDGFTLYGYYKAATGDEEFSWPYSFGTEDTTVYVGFIEGKWKIVKDVKSFKDAISYNNDVYLDADLDFTDETWITRSYGGTINGNGHKITGIKVGAEGSKTEKEGFGIFNVLRNGAKLYDLEIEAEVSFRAAFDGNEFKVGFLAYEAEEGVKINNVKVSGTLSYDGTRSINTEAYPWIAVDDTRAEDVAGNDYTGVAVVDLAAI